MSIVVTGATGHLGRLAVESLLARGVPAADIVATGRRVDVISESAVPVQIDGDPGGRLPLHVRLHEHQLPLIKPMAS